MKVKLYKVSELPDAMVPHNISIGYVCEGTLYTDIVIGRPVDIGLIRTSVVTEIINESTFKTMNSVYHIVKEHEIPKPKPFFNWEY